MLPGKSSESTESSSSVTAKIHARKALQVLKKLAANVQNPVIYLEGEISRSRHDGDRELPFRQESNFYYLTGCDLPGAHLVISASKDDCLTTLYVPPIDKDSVMWMGLPPTIAELQRTHNVDKVEETQSMTESISNLLKQDGAQLFLLPWTKSPVSDPGKSDTTLLRDAIAEARLIKTPEEIEILREANEISSRAHESVMRAVGRGELHSEYEAQALFEFECKRKGSKTLAYEAIFAYGTSSATLHYTDNRQKFNTSKGNLCLVDAACEINTYDADITRCWPVGNGGRFTKEGREIYELVLEMQETALKEMKAGESWPRIHLLMHEVVVRGMLKLGVLVAGPSKATGEDLVKELYKKDLSIPFFPHGKFLQPLFSDSCVAGLGHCLGLDVHDTPGNASRPDGPAKQPKLKYLRYLRELVEGQCITVEPGCYFNSFLLDPFKDSPHLNHQLIREKYLPVGGVRIEDNVIITKDGIDNLTTAIKTVADVEAFTSSR